MELPRSWILTVIPCLCFHVDFELATLSSQILTCVPFSISFQTKILSWIQIALLELIYPCLGVLCFLQLNWISVSSHYLHIIPSKLYINEITISQLPTMHKWKAVFSVASIGTCPIHADKIEIFMLWESSH